MIPKSWKRIIKHNEVSCVNCENFKCIIVIGNFTKHYTGIPMIFCPKRGFKRKLSKIKSLDYTKRAENCPDYFPMYDDFYFDRLIE